MAKGRKAVVVSDQAPLCDELAPPPLPPARVKKSAVQAVMDAYHEEFLGRHGVKPKIEGSKDGPAIKRMVATWGEEAVLALVPKFIASNDPWAVRCGWTISCFSTMAQRLMVAPPQGISDHTANNLDAVARATGRKREGM